MTSPGCSSCISGPTTTRRNWPPGCGAPSTGSTWHAAEPRLRGNFPMALATAGETLAIVFRNPPRLVLLDPRDGKVQANQQTCGDGRVDVFARQAVAWRPLGQVSQG